MPQLTTHLRNSLLVALGLTTPLQGCTSPSEPPQRPESPRGKSSASLPDSVQHLSVILGPDFLSETPPEAPEKGIVEANYPPPEQPAPLRTEPAPDPALLLSPTGNPFLDAGGVIVDLKTAEGPVHGRPLQIHGIPRTASAASKSDWADRIEGQLGELTLHERARLAAGWSKAGLVEHASIASFSRFTLQLMGLGAPPDLIRDASLAQADEVLHARHCFSIASAFAGHPVGPGPLDLQDVWTESPAPERVLLETIHEGCINETVAAAEARWLAERTQAPILRTVLIGIAQDESRHAALAWRTVQWLLQTFPELHSTAQAAFKTSVDARIPPSHSPRDSWMATYGIMPRAAGMTLRENTLCGVVAPCAKRLIRSTNAA